MKKKYIIRSLILIFLAIAMLFGMQVFMSNPDSHVTLAVYSVEKEPEDSIDVALIGTSDIYTGYFSTLAYEKEGFTSAVLAIPGMRGSLFKYAIKLIKQKQNPDLYVLELYSFYYNDQYSEPDIRKWIDVLPYGSVKFEAINELVLDEDKSSYYVPLAKYHTAFDRIDVNLKVLQEKKFIASKGYSIIKNFSTNTSNLVGKDDKQKVDLFTISEQGLSFLNNLLEYLKENGIENVLFIRVPERDTIETSESYYTALGMIEEAGYDFLDMNEYADEINLDRDIDYYNAGHVNIYGAEKITGFLSDYIVNNYNIDMSHSPEVTEEWDTCASYNEQIISKLKADTDANKGQTVFCNIDLIK